MTRPWGRSAELRKSRTLDRGTSVSLTAVIVPVVGFSWTKIQPVTELTYWRTASTDASFILNVSFFSWTGGLSWAQTGNVSTASTRATSVRFSMVTNPL